MIIRENDCVACETCIGCGRREDYYFHVCDRCESSEQLYDYYGEELCAECLLKEFKEIDMEDF